MKAYKELMNDSSKLSEIDRKLINFLDEDIKMLFDD